MSGWGSEWVSEWVTEWTNTLERKKLCPHKSVSWGISPNNITNTTPVNNNDWVPCVMFSSERCVFPRLLFVVQRLSVFILQTRKMGTETSHNGAGTCLPGLQLGAWSLHPYLHAHFGVFFRGQGSYFHWGIRSDLWHGLTSRVKRFCMFLSQLRYQCLRKVVVTTLNWP